MMTSEKIFALLAALAVLSAPTARADEEATQAIPPAPPAAAQPPSPAPSEVPQPPADVPAPPTSAAPAAPVAPSGQWVYTQQYGWVWMPYGNAYTYLPPDGGWPSMYVYYPAYGWSWVVAPWIWGWGPAPYFGVYGAVQFGWWGHGFGRWYGFRNHAYPGWRHRGVWNGGGWGAVPAPSRGGSASPPRGARGQGQGPAAAPPRSGNSRSGSAGGERGGHR